MQAPVLSQEAGTVMLKRTGSLRTSPGAELQAPTSISSGSIDARTAFIMSPDSSRLSYTTIPRTGKTASRAGRRDGISEGISS
jgi:hypothetical protein